MEYESFLPGNSISWDVIESKNFLQIGSSFDGGGMLTHSSYFLPIDKKTIFKLIWLKS